MIFFFFFGAALCSDATFDPSQLLNPADLATVGAFKDFSLVNGGFFVFEILFLSQWHDVGVLFGSCIRAQCLWTFPGYVCTSCIGGD